MLNYDELALGEGGPWLGPLAIPGEQAGRLFPKQEALARIDRLAGAKNLAFTGGEPLAHPDIIEIVRAARVAGYERILARTDCDGLADRDLLGSVMGEGVSHFEVMLCREGDDCGPLSPRQFRTRFPGIRNVRRIGELSEALSNTYLAAVIPVGRKNHELMAGFLESAFATIDIDRVVFCWGDPGFPIWHARESIARAIDQCTEKRVWAVTRGIPLCVVPRHAAHLEELFAPGVRGTALPVPASCGPCCYRPICSGMPGAGSAYAWDPEKAIPPACPPEVADIWAKGHVFDETNAHLYDRR